MNGIKVIMGALLARVDEYPLPIPGYHYAIGRGYSSTLRFGVSLGIIFISIGHRNADQPKTNGTEILYYHISIMEQADLIDTTRGGYGGYPVCRLTWNGNDFLNDIEQEGVIEEIEAAHGRRWLEWSLDVMKAVSVEVAKQLALKPLL